ncbi:hypothetical protein ACFYO1_13060 [Nocardia sp. NPDC006044]|uniref:hypothetical protein n=1 Tax=Nocardia sp. NPDC006044 TaxID=3364306 RepID=UPI0036BA7CC4
MQLAYDSGIINLLPEFDEAKELISKGEDRLLELGDIICRHRLHEDAGLCLLHRHFDLADDERLVGTYDQDDYVVRVSRRPAWSGVVPSVWRVESLGSESGWGYRPVEFADTAGAGAKLGLRAARTMANREFLREMAQQLRSLELNGIVGVAILDRLPGDLRPDEIVYETSSQRGLVSTRSQIGRDSISREEVTVTLWAFQAEPAI